MDSAVDPARCAKHAKQFESPLDCRHLARGSIQYVELSPGQRAKHFDVGPGIGRLPYLDPSLGSKWLVCSPKRWSFDAG